MTSVSWNINLEKSFNTIFNNRITIKQTIIEIGCFEGYGTLKLHSLLGTHSESKIICIDPWDDCYVKNKGEFSDIDPIFVGQYDKFISNTISIKDKLDIKRGYSTDILKELEPKSIDFAYVDGDHSANQVYIDGCLLFPLMKQGGIILFDDYYWTHNNEITQIGIDRFINEYRESIDVLFIGPVQCAIKIK
jgi:predicted O-methyltransferase YrrM